MKTTKEKDKQTVNCLEKTLKLMKGIIREGHTAQVYIDKRDGDRVITVIKNDNGQEPLIRISEEVLQDLRKNKYLSSDTMHPAWRREKSIYDFINKLNN